jgi:hypothetical protein
MPHLLLWLLRVALGPIRAADNHVECGGTNLRVEHTVFSAMSKTVRTELDGPVQLARRAYAQDFFDKF